MGGMEVARTPGISDLEFFRKQLGAGETGPRGTFRILDAASKVNVCYMVVQWERPDGSKEPRECVVANFTRLRNGRFFYNAHGETSGPIYRDCPERILKQLDPIVPCEHPQGEDRAMRLTVGANVESCGTDYAIQWRADCQAVIDARRQAVSVEVGDTFRLKEALSCEGQLVDTFTLIQRPRQRNLAKDSRGLICRLPSDWRTRVSEVIARQGFRQTTLVPVASRLVA
jgi:hypothetical protein